MPPCVCLRQPVPRLVKILGQLEQGQKPTLVPYSVSHRVEFLGGQGLMCRDDNGERTTHLHGSISDHNGMVRGATSIQGRITVEMIARQTGPNEGVS